MDRLRRGVLTGVWLGLAVMVMECEAYGQRGGSTSGAASTQFVPVPFMLPMGQSSPFGGGAGGGDGSTGASGTANVFNNPAASPMLYGSMFPMSRNQMGWMMMANQAQMTGQGLSSRTSGTRPGTGPSARGQAASGRSSAPKRGSAGTPGGLAAHYFNRTKSNTARLPQGYYNRQSRYFPDSSH